MMIFLFFKAEKLAYISITERQECSYNHQEPELFGIKITNNVFKISSFKILFQINTFQQKAKKNNKSEIFK